MRCMGVLAAGVIVAAMLFAREMMHTTAMRRFVLQAVLSCIRDCFFVDKTSCLPCLPMGSGRLRKSAWSFT